MFADYVYEQSGAPYESRILLLDDGIEAKQDYLSAFAAHGFRVLFYEDDLQYRIHQEERVKSGTEKDVLLASPKQYIPYDVRKLFHVYHVAYETLFPKLDPNVLYDTKNLNLEQLCLAYEESYGSLSDAAATEKFLRDVYESPAVVKKYIRILENSLESAINNAESYTDWFRVAAQKAEMDVLATRYKAATDAVKVQKPFTDFIMHSFGKLSMEVNARTPVLVSRTMEFMREHSEKFAIIVMDGMSEFDWEILADSFSELHYHKSDVFAMIPTVTSVSRQCLLSNKYPSQLIDPWTQANEKKEFVACATALGYRKEQVAYCRGYEAEVSAGVRCAAIIINDIDDIVHGQLQGRVGMYHDMALLRDQEKLCKLAQKLLKQGLDVYISADHGNVPAVGMGRLGRTGVETETKSHRMLVMNSLAETKALKQKYGLIEFPKYYLPKELTYLICDAGSTFDDPGESVMTHGGITIEECIVPFITIKARENNG